MKGGSQSSKTGSFTAGVVAERGRGRRLTGNTGACDLFAAMGAPFSLMRCVTPSSRAVLFPGTVFVGSSPARMEAAAGAFVCNRLVGFAGSLHCRNRIWDGDTGSSIVSCIKAVNGSSDGSDIRGAWSIEHEGLGKVFAKPAKVKFRRLASRSLFEWCPQPKSNISPTATPLLNTLVESTERPRLLILHAL